MPNSSTSLYLIDGISPFFCGDDRASIDWSQIPWDRIAKMEAKELGDFFDQVRVDLHALSRSVVNIGYTGIILDDVFHLTPHEFYESDVTERIEIYREAFKKIFKSIKKEGLQIFLTMNVMSFTPAQEKKIGRGENKQNAFLAELLGRFLDDFPEVDGVVLRPARDRKRESNSGFLARSVLKNSAMVNRCLKAILPVFEKHERSCIFRNWFDCNQAWENIDLGEALNGINSPALILSLRYSEGGVSRYSTLSPNFFATETPILLELQARRENEGCGEYPAFIGYQYEKIAAELSDVPNMLGISVSCQTGGVSPFRRLAFVQDEAIWTEINAFVTLRIFRYGELVEEAVSRLPGAVNPTALLELLRLSEEAIQELLYFPEFARHRLYFSGHRIGPRMGIYQNQILVSDSIKRLLRRFTIEPGACIRSGETALSRVRRMRMLALECNLPEADIEFMEATFDILVFSRDYYFRNNHEVYRGDLEASVKRYREKFPSNGLRRRYSVRLDLKSDPISKRFFTRFLQWRKRRKSGFRLVDEMIKLEIVSRFGFLLKPSQSKKNDIFSED